MNKKEKTIDFVLCLFLGYLGIHKFYEKKTGLGILYLFTLGIFGIGWIIDIIRLLIDLLKEYLLQTPNNEINTNIKTENTSLHISSNSQFDTNVAGVTFDDRQDILKHCEAKQKVYIKWDKDNPYSETGHALAVFTIIDGIEKQLGHIPEKSTNFLFQKFENEFNTNDTFFIEGYIDKITGGTDDKPTLGCVIKIDL